MFHDDGHSIKARADRNTRHEEQSNKQNRSPSQKRKLENKLRVISDVLIMDLHLVSYLDDPK